MSTNIQAVFVFVSSSAGSDYVSTNVVLTFTAGGVDEQNTIDVPIVNDTSVEDLEQFFADLVLVTTPLNVTVEPTRATVLIVDEDGKALYCGGSTVKSTCYLVHFVWTSKYTSIVGCMRMFSTVVVQCGSCRKSLVMQVLQ